MWAQPELIEAASRTGQTQQAADALDRLAEATGVSQTDWAQGIYARCRALLRDGQDAEDSYREAIDGLGRTGFRTELARAHLLYGEWLRRQGRRTDARAQLHTAYDMFAAIGMEAFAERARQELEATGETVRKRTTTGTGDQLTPRRPRLPSWPGRVCPTRRSPPSCSCPRGRSNGTCARSSPSWTSAPAGSSTKRCPTAPKLRRGHNPPVRPDSLEPSWGIPQPSGQFSPPSGDRGHALALIHWPRGYR
jgi:hypothetical protein